MSEVHVCAIITPAAGKESQVRELLSGLAANVKKYENEVAKYQLFEQYDSESGVNVFVVQELYTKDGSRAAYDAHFKTDYFTALAEKIPAGGLVAKPLDIMTIKPVAGFASR